MILEFIQKSQSNATCISWKIKFYISVNEKVDDKQNYITLENKLENKINRIISELKINWWGILKKY